MTNMKIEFAVLSNSHISSKKIGKVLTLETRLARYAAKAFRYSFLAASVLLL